MNTEALESFRQQLSQQMKVSFDKLSEVVADAADKGTPTQSTLISQDTQHKRVESDINAYFLKAATRIEAGGTALFKAAMHLQEKKPELKTEDILKGLGELVTFPSRLSDFR